MYGFREKGPCQGILGVQLGGGERCKLMWHQGVFLFAKQITNIGKEN